MTSQTTLDPKLRRPLDDYLARVSSVLTYSGVAAPEITGNTFTQSGENDVLVKGALYGRDLVLSPLISGNTFMIRHTEVGKKPITKSEQVDYVFQRMFAVVRLLLKGTGRGG